jgi:hypothetical protein
MALKTAEDFSKLSKKCYLKELSSMNSPLVLHPIKDVSGILLSLSVGHDLLLSKY